MSLTQVHGTVSGSRGGGTDLTVPALRKQTQETQELKANLGHTTSLSALASVSQRKAQQTRDRAVISTQDICFLLDKVNLLQV